MDFGAPLLLLRGYQWHGMPVRYLSGLLSACHSRKLQAPVLVPDGERLGFDFVIVCDRIFFLGGCCSASSSLKLLSPIPKLQLLPRRPAVGRRAMKEPRN